VSAPQPRTAHELGEARLPRDLTEAEFEQAKALAKRMNDIAGSGPFTPKGIAVSMFIAGLLRAYAPDLATARAQLDEVRDAADEFLESIWERTPGEPGMSRHDG
jgi:hypothetical protein